jgi:hypothetical protein
MLVHGLADRQQTTDSVSAHTKMRIYGLSCIHSSCVIKCIAQFAVIEHRDGP